MTDEPTTTRPLPDLVSEGDVLMLTTASDGMLSRPITTAEVGAGHLAFLVSGAAPWVHTLAEALPADGVVVGLSYADHGSTKYVAMRARAHVNGNRARVEMLWTPLAKAFFEGPDDPDVCVLEVQVEAGEWWDGPSTGVGRIVSLVKAAVSHDGMSGDSGDVSVPGRTS